MTHYIKIKECYADAIMEELKGIKAMIEKDDHNGSRTEKEDASE